MPNLLEGTPTADAGDRYAIVVSRFNDVVTRKLLEGAVATLKERGVPEEHILVACVPGAFEIPLVAERLAAGGECAAVICLGAVVQGETQHHEYINSAVSQGIMQSSQKWRIPVLFGVLTCRNMEQALDRAGGQAGNKGSEAALAAVEMVSLLKQLPSQA